MVYYFFLWIFISLIMNEAEYLSLRLLVTCTSFAVNVRLHSLLIFCIVLPFSCNEFYNGEICLLSSMLQIAFFHLQLLLSLWAWNSIRIIFMCVSGPSSLQDYFLKDPYFHFYLLCFNMWFIWNVIGCKKQILKYFLRSSQTFLLLFPITRHRLKAAEGGADFAIPECVSLAWG